MNGKEYKFDEVNYLNFKTSQVIIKNMLKSLKNDFPLVIDSKGVEFYSFPCSFDIETTSIYKKVKTKVKTKDKKRFKERIVPECGFMYCWQFGLNGKAIIGRTWKDFQQFCQIMKTELELEPTKRNLLVFIHNMDFEFQHMRKFFKWNKTFFGNNRSIMYGLTEDGILFRDSYIYTGKKLEDVANGLIKYKISKKVGQLDYSKIRTSQTKLTQQEIEYCISDVIILNNFIQEEAENTSWEYILSCLTKTSKVRLDGRMNCFFDEIDGKLEMNKQRVKFIKSLTLSPNDYRILRRAYCGGFTHSNKIWVRKHLHNVHSRDFTSSYPAVLISEKFVSAPYKEIKELSLDTFFYYIKNNSDYASLFDIEIYGVQSKGYADDIISSSKIWNWNEIKDDCIVNNGRLVENMGDKPILTTMTEIQFIDFINFYNFTSIKLLNFRYAPKSYLPKWFIEIILHYYKEKTKFKGVKGKETEYQRAKELLNSLYGMLVEDLLHENSQTFDESSNEYISTTIRTSQSITDEELKKIVKKYNRKSTRFTFYPWGIECTDYARHNLFTALIELGNDYIYSDTDSVKYFNDEKHRDYFERYNEQVTKKIENCLRYHNIDNSEAAPVDVNGIPHPLGVWDWETEPLEDGTDMSYQSFKTLGAKRYLVAQYNKKTNNISIKCTVAGLGKKDGSEYIGRGYEDGTRTIDEIFDEFDDNLTVPAENTGKLTHFYIDNQVELDVTDYQGNTEHIISPSSICLAPCEFSMSMSDDFITLLDSLDTMDISGGIYEGNVGIK